MKAELKKKEHFKNENKHKRRLFLLRVSYGIQIQSHSKLNTFYPGLIVIDNLKECFIKGMSKADQCCNSTAQFC